MSGSMLWRAGTTTTVRERAFTVLAKMEVAVGIGPRLNLGEGRSIEQRHELMEAALEARYGAGGEPAAGHGSADGAPPSDTAGAGDGQIPTRDRPGGMEAPAVGGAAEGGHGNDHGEGAPVMIPVSDMRWERSFWVLP